MKVVKDTQEIVSPTTPSPVGALELSDNDQAMIPVYISVLLFFQETPAPEAFTILKTSLAETLSSFYPLAGRFREKKANGELQIVCNDEGAVLYEAWVDCGFDSFLPNFDPHPDFDLLAPQLDIFADISSLPLLVAQITQFECGRICLGIRMHHIVGDGLSMFHFLSCWADISKAKVQLSGAKKDVQESQRILTIKPYLDRSLLKARNPPCPTEEHPEYQAQMPVFDPAPPFNPVVSKIFSFAPSALGELRVRAASCSGGAPPGQTYTRVEALSAHLWRGISYARGLAAEQDIKLGVSVDGRKKLNPPLPEGYFGNVVFYACAHVCKAGELVEGPLSFGADVVRSAIAKVNDRHMRSALDWVAKQESPRSVSVSNSRPVDLSISCWLRFPLYELDFGWGKPSHVRIPFVFEGLVVLLPSPLGEGHVDALVPLNAQQMSAFEYYLNHVV